MRTVRNITVAVEPELYRQTRRIAAGYDTARSRVPELVRPLHGKKPNFVLYACKCRSTTFSSATCKATTCVRTG